VPNQKGGLLDRLKVLQDYLKTQPNTPIKIIKQYPVLISSKSPRFVHNSPSIENGG
jgi:DNA ligase-1